MRYITNYTSPVGNILLAADEGALTGLWFEGQKFYARGLGREYQEKEVPVLEQTRNWLDIYFSGTEPDFRPPLHLAGSAFQKDVWEILCRIPYGKTTTYGAVAGELARKRGQARMSARAVGGAVARNAVSIIVPCHRVTGADGSLTGYAGGMERKRFLLKLEKTQTG